MCDFIKLKNFNIERLSNVNKINKKLKKKNDIISYNQIEKKKRYVKFQTVYNKKYIAINSNFFNKINKML